MAEKKTKNNAVKDARLREDIASFKLSLAFLLFGAVIFFIATNLQYTQSSLYMPLWMFIADFPWIMLVPVALLGLSIYWYTSVKKAKKDEGFSYFASADAVTISLFVLSFLLVFMMTYSMALLVTFTVAFALCYYSIKLFTRDFMIVTFENAAMAMLLWLVAGQSFTTGLIPGIAKVIFLAVCALTVIGSLAVTVLVYAKKIPACGKCSYLPVIISFVIGAALFLIMTFSPGLISLAVAEIILLVQYVALGVYYTVRVLNQ